MITITKAAPQTISLLRGDCLEILPTLPSKSVDLICCDLPFGVTTIHWDNVLPMDALWHEYKRLLKPTGCVVLFGIQPFTSHLILSNLEWFKYELVWNKNKCGSPGLAKYRPMRTHENIVVFAEGKTVYHPQMEKGTPYARKSKNPEGYVGKKNDHGYGLKPVMGFTNEGTRYPKSIINISRDFSAQQQSHPTQKPVPLLEWLIKTYSNLGDVVLDNTAGVFSTGVACVNLNRSFIGIEKDLDYFNIGLERMKGAIKCQSSKTELMIDMGA